MNTAWENLSDAQKKMFSEVCNAISDLPYHLHRRTNDAEITLTDNSGNQLILRTPRP